MTLASADPMQLLTALPPVSDGAPAHCFRFSPPATEPRARVVSPTIREGLASLAAAASGPVGIDELFATEAAALGLPVARPDEAQARWLSAVSHALLSGFGIEYALREHGRLERLQERLVRLEATGALEELGATEGLEVSGPTGRSLGRLTFRRLGEGRRVLLLLEPSGEVLILGIGNRTSLPTAIARRVGLPGATFLYRHRGGRIELATELDAPLTVALVHGLVEHAAQPGATVAGTSGEARGVRLTLKPCPAPPGPVARRLVARPRLRRQLDDPAHLLFWRDAASGGREGLLVEPRRCEAPGCSCEAVLLEVSRVDERLVAVLHGGGRTRETVWFADVPASEAELLEYSPSTGALTRSRGSSDDDGLAWLRGELDAELRGLLSTAAGPPRRAQQGRVGRNDPCPCGSGRKHKRCCAP